MNARTAAPIAVIASLVVLMSGGAAAHGAQGGQVHDDLSPLANAAAVALARGHVVVKDDLSPTRVQNRITALMADQAVQERSARSFSADARRELHSQQVTVGQAPFSADARRELHSQQVTVEQAPFSADVIRELKSTAPDPVDDVLSPIGDSR